MNRLQTEKAGTMTKNCLRNKYYRKRKYTYIFFYIMHIVYITNAYKCNLLIKF